jgi:hypothetical protein
MINFRTLNIWQEGITIVTNVYKLAELLPAEEKYGLEVKSVALPYLNHQILLKVAVETVKWILSDF